MNAYSLLAVVAAYLLGSLSFAVVVSKAMGLADPRTFGSKNPGATNVLRSGSKKAAAITLLLDALKGWLPVFVVQHWGGAYGMGAVTLALVGLAAFAGHVWPLYFGFKGGKGVATFLGVVFGINPWLGLMAVAAWLLIALASKYSSLAAIVASVATALLYILLGDSLWWGETAITIVLLIMAAVLIYRHKENIDRLIKGTESKIGSQKKSS